MGFGNFNSNILGGLTPPRRQTLARPVYDPIDMSGIEASRKRMQDADRLAQDPLSAPGVQQQLGVISEGLNRQFQSEKGNTLSRAAQSGQAGFGGAFAQTASQLSGSLAASRAQEQSDMMMDVYSKARQEGLSANEAMTQAQGEVSRIKNERSRIDADITAQEADLWQREQSDYQRALIDQARIAEDARQSRAADRRERDKMDFDRQRDEYERTHNAQIEAESLRRDDRDFNYERETDTRSYNTQQTGRREDRADRSVTVRREEKARRDAERDAEEERVRAAFEESYARQHEEERRQLSQGQGFRSDAPLSDYELDQEERRKAKRWHGNFSNPD